MVRKEEEVRHGRNFDKSTSQRSIEQFMRKAEQEVPDKPCIPSDEVRFLRAKLILEEAFETVAALGFNLYIDGDFEIPVGVEELYIEDERKPNLVEIADGCADIEVVTKGTLSACGICDIPIQEEVNRTNLAKFTGDGHKNEHGKWVKPSDWKPPEIERLLKEQGWAVIL